MCEHNSDISHLLVLLFTQVSTYMLQANILVTDSKWAEGHFKPFRFLAWNHTSVALLVFWVIVLLKVKHRPSLTLSAEYL